MIGQTERDDKGVEAQFMKKKILVLLVCSMLTLPTTVSADILDYEGTVNAYKEDNKIPQTFEIDDGSGEKVTAVAKSDKVSVSAKATYIRSMPGKNGKKLVRVYLGTGVERVAVCDNGWSKVTYEKKSKKGTEKISGYVPTKHINDSDQVAQAKGTFTALKDSDILDYPGKKDGQVVGEVIQEDEVKRLATVNGIWSQIYYKKENGKRSIGYIPTSVLENTAAEENTEESKVAKVDGEEAGTILKSKGKGVFAEAVDGVTASKGESVDGVKVGTPVAVSSDASLVPLGTFKITHYCPCSICCGLCSCQISDCRTVTFLFNCPNCFNSITDCLNLFDRFIIQLNVILLFNPHNNLKNIKRVCTKIIYKCSVFCDRICINIQNLCYDSFYFLQFHLQPSFLFLFLSCSILLRTSVLPDPPGYALRSSR